MYCTSCGSNLGTWTNRSCPRCGSPLRQTDPITQNTKPAALGASDPTTSPMPAAPRKRTGVLWLIGLCIFAVIAATAWWALTTKNPFVDTKNNETELTEKKQGEKEQQEQEQRERELREREQREQELREQELREQEQREQELREQEQREREQREREQREREQREREKGRVAAALRKELSECQDFRCHMRAKQKHCPGYQNLIPECRNAL